MSAHTILCVCRMRQLFFSPSRGEQLYILIRFFIRFGVSRSCDRPLSLLSHLRMHCGVSRSCDRPLSLLPHLRLHFGVSRSCDRHLCLSLTLARMSPHGPHGGDIFVTILDHLWVSRRDIRYVLLYPLGEKIAHLHKNTQ